VLKKAEHKAENKLGPDSGKPWLANKESSAGIKLASYFQQKYKSKHL
jgi:hypothetical protein